MALADRFHHTMRVEVAQGTGPVIEGLRDETPVLSPPIRCLLTTAPMAGQADPAGRRASQGPTLLCAPTDTAGGVIGLRPGAIVVITAPQVHNPQGLPDPTRYEVDGVQPLAKPGQAPMGFNASLVRVRD